METEPKPIDFIAIHEAFAETEYGQILASNIRYSPFKPPDMSNEHWVELLGPDVNNLTHLLDTYDLTCSFIGHTERLDPSALEHRGKVILKAGAISHDWAESIKTDINYLDKTDQDEIDEQATFIEYLDDFAAGCPDEAKALIVEALGEVIFNRESRLGRMFNAVERIGYMRTSLRADEHVQTGTATDHESHLRWLSASVLSAHHTSHLIAAGQRFPAVQHFLSFQRPAITQAFQTADPEIFYEHWPAEKASIRTAALKDSYEVWESWSEVAIEDCNDDDSL